MRVPSILLIAVGVVVSSCADGGGDPARGRVHATPAHLAGGSHGDDGAYDAWDFYGQSIEYDSILIESSRDDGAPASITATPGADGAVSITASVDGEEGNVTLAADGTLLAMNMDGDAVRALFVEAASDLVDQGAALTVSDAETLASYAGLPGGAAATGARGDDEPAAGAQQALDVLRWVVDVQCMWAKLVQHQTHVSPELSCDVSLSAERRLALQRQPGITFAIRGGLQFGSNATFEYWSVVDDQHVMVGTGVTGTGTIYQTLRPRDGDLTRRGHLQIRLYRDPRNFTPSILSYGINGWGYGARMKLIDLTGCSEVVCAGAEMCNAGTCESAVLDGATLPYANLGVLSETN